MTTQFEWIDLKDRTEEVRELVMQVVDIATLGNEEPELVYREYNWGLVSNTVLCSALLEMKKDCELQTHEQILAARGTYSSDPSGQQGVQEDIDDSFSYKRKPETIITRDLSWFIQNGESAEVRLKAKEYREKLLLDLYLEHVKQTGETYFPQLQQLLEAEWKFKFQGDDNA
jgi:hypothetical protein